MPITKQEADTIFRLARALEDTGRLCSLSDSDSRMEWRQKNQETQCALQDVLKQLQEPEAVSTKTININGHEVPEPLTDEQIEQLFRKVEVSDFHDCVVPFAHAIEAAHGIKE